MQKIPIAQSGSPDLSSPNAYYNWYHVRHGLQDQKRMPFLRKEVPLQEKFARVLKVYYEIAKKIIEDLKPQYISEVETLNSYIQKLESRIDNKLRIGADGKNYLLVNGKIKFDGSNEMYEELFQSGKIPFREFIKNVANELITTIKGGVPDEEDKALIIGDGGTIEQPKEPITVAVDLDNTLIDKEENPIEGAAKALQLLKDKGFEVVIYTARFAGTPKEEWQSLLSYVEGILNKHSIPFDRISIEKPICKYFIDDRAIPFNNWSDVMNLLNVEEDAMGGFGPQDKNKEKEQTPELGMLEMGDGIQDLKPSELQQSKIGQAVGGGIREENTFKFLTQEEIHKKVYEQIGKELQ